MTVPAWATALSTSSLVTSRAVCNRWCRPQSRQTSLTAFPGGGAGQRPGRQMQAGPPSAALLKPGPYSVGTFTVDSEEMPEGAVAYLPLECGSSDVLQWDSGHVGPPAPGW